MPLVLDHLVIAVRDLDAATDNYRLLLGRKPSWKGRHPQYGTANVLFRFDDGYLELLAPEPESATGPDWARSLRSRLDAAGEGVYALALGTDDIDADVARLRGHGLRVADPAPGTGVDEVSGARREWRNARIDTASTRGCYTFIIQHASPPSALPEAEPTGEAGAIVTGFDHTVIGSSNLPETLRLWDEAFDLDLRASVERPGGRTLHFLRMGGSILELAGESAPDSPGDRDAYWGVAYRVGSVAKTVARLRAEGVSVSDPRTGNAPGTEVADLKRGFSHDVRTLFIQKETPA